MLDIIFGIDLRHVGAPADGEPRMADFTGQIRNRHELSWKNLTLDTELDDVAGRQWPYAEGRT